MKSLYTKFLFITLLIMIASSLIGFFIANSYYQNNLKPENDSKNMEIVTGIANYAETQDDLNQFFTHTASTGYQLLVVNQQGDKEFYGGQFDEKNLPTKAIEKVLNGDSYHGMRDFPKGTFVTGFFANDLQNSVGVPFRHNGTQYALFLRPNIKLLFNELHILLGWMALAIFILSLLAVLIWAAILIRPVRQLSHATNEIGENGFNVNLDIHRSDEIGQLAQNFKDMTSRLEDLDEVRKSFVSNVSHDIQTPLLNIQGYSRLLKNSTLSDEEKNSYLEVIQEETERMSILSKQLLTLSSLEPNSHTYSIKEINISEQIQSLLHKYYWLINENELSLTYSLEDITVKGNPDLLYTVWENLLTNAIKYNEPGGSIEIKAEKTNNQLAIEFTDSGVGIKSNEQSQIFDRFYRGDSARTRTNQGTGLGLSIVKEVIELHEGNIYVYSQLEKGTTFKIIFPRL
ncbi:sensor histidine kinase [Alkalibacillus almallahensis]|uniref:sensor histidine kinase n=1 Tax=Alkalibacillus almallahensis TaxID=1379154 RepID=UPI0014214BA3|nr:HAMP domain-containing sensor histidine kinase [Alkalibacillus almallahensis]NIK12567.1 signal transduction histidine kinase [Alkalibacillus almallahensis]